MEASVGTSDAGGAGRVRLDHRQVSVEATYAVMRNWLTSAGYGADMLHK